MQNNIVPIGHHAQQGVAFRQTTARVTRGYDHALDFIGRQRLARAAGLIGPRYRRLILALCPFRCLGS
jgi:hypothetical protein